MINRSKVTVLHAYELFLSPCNDFGGFSDFTIQSDRFFVIMAREEGSSSLALLISLCEDAAEHSDLKFLYKADNLIFHENK